MKTPRLSAHFAVYMHRGGSLLRQEPPPPPAPDAVQALPGPQFGPPQQPPYGAPPSGYAQPPGNYPQYPPGPPPPPPPGAYFAGRSELVAPSRLTHIRIRRRGRTRGL